MGRVARVDPDQLAALCRLRTVVDPIGVLEILNQSADQDQAATHGGYLISRANMNPRRA